MAWIYDDTRGQDRHAWANDSSEAVNNAWEMYRYFITQNPLTTVEALCGIVGNVCAESHIDPWQEQVGSGHGFGLIQWTPPTSLTDVFGNPLPTGDDQCSLIFNEIMDNQVMWGGGARWIPTSAYPYTGQQFSNLTDIYEATRAYFYERERGTWSNSRLTWAAYYYEVFTGSPPPTPPTPPTPTRTRDKMPLYLYTCKQMRIKKGLI